jgi:hypothetical protein
VTIRRCPQPLSIFPGEGLAAEVLISRGITISLCPWSESVASLAFRSDQWPSPFTHILCAIHKGRNVLRELSGRDLPKQVQETTTRVLRQVLNTDQKPDAISCLNKHATPRSTHFAKPFIPYVFTGGGDRTFEAESMNILLKVACDQTHLCPPLVNGLPFISPRIEMI